MKVLITGAVVDDNLGYQHITTSITADTAAVVIIHVGNDLPRVPPAILTDKKLRIYSFGAKVLFGE